MTMFVKIASQMAAGVKREWLSPGKVRLILPWGFPYEAFGSNVVVKPWHVLSLVESGRVLSFNRMPNDPGDPFLMVEDLYRDYGVFMGSAQLTIAKEMYDITLTKTPFTLEKELVYVGKSSMNLHTDVVLPPSNLTLASCEVQSVIVDRKTRRPAPFPDWWRERFGGFSTPGRQLKVNVQRAPEQTGPRNNGNGSEEPEVRHHQKFSHRQATEERLYQDLSQTEHHQDLPVTETVTSFDLQITNSEIDGYGHVNWAMYLKYCWDALVTGSRSEVRHILQSLALKSADISFVGEGSAGQRITVRFWKDRAVPRAVHFNIVDSDSDQLINYAFFQFYSKQEIRLPVAKL